MSPRPTFADRVAARRAELAANLPERMPGRELLDVLALGQFLQEAGALAGATDAKPPRGARPCRACGAWLSFQPAPSGRWQPVELATGKPHWSRCPDAALFRQRGRASRQQLDLFNVGGGIP